MLRPHKIDLNTARLCNKTVMAVGELITSARSIRSVCTASERAPRAAFHCVVMLVVMVSLMAAVVLLLLLLLLSSSSSLRCVA